jgi:uncharacterized membrane-anchored protein YitT (DUF2179 family)
VIDVVVILIGELINVIAFRSLIVPSRLISGGVVSQCCSISFLQLLPIGCKRPYNIPIRNGHRFWAGVSLC